MMSEDGFERTSGEKFWQLVAAQHDHSLEERLQKAQVEGLAANLQRQLDFVGTESLFEVQALGVRRYPNDAYERSRAAHGRSVDEVIALCSEADGWIAHGIYLLPARLRAGVETRHAHPGRWFDVAKGGGTTDSDIEARLILAIDFDVKRPSATSATEEEMQRSVRVALNAWSYLAHHLGESSLAYLHSGNGRQIHIALDVIAVNDASKSALSGLLTGLGHLFNTAEVAVDEKLFDAKRILPACGTMKKKGAPDVADRPHRRTAIVTPAQPTRVPLDKLIEFARFIWEGSDLDGRLAIEKSFGVKPSSTTVTELRPNTGSPFDLAKGVDPQQVAEWLGLYNERGHVVCPGCGETAGVAVLNKGLKCHHNRCKDKGLRGFRNNIELVSEVHHVLPKEAVLEISERFGLNVHFQQETAPAQTASVSTARFTKISTDQIFEELPPIRWLVKDLHLVAGRPTLIAGYGFSGKTLVAQSLGLSVASAYPVWGKFTPSQPSNVWHLDYEQGGYATKRRYQRLARGHGIPRDAIGDRLQVTIFPDVYLDSPDAVDAYARAVEGVPVAILDALRGATPTMDENDSTIRRCLDNLTRISERTGTAFIVLHHAGKSRDNETSDPRKIPRGSSAIFDACGCVLSIEGPKNEPKLVVQTKAPAEAEGSALEDFYVAIDDVPGPCGPNEGLRVLYLEGNQTRVQVAINKDLNIRDRIVQAIQGFPGQFNSANSILRAVGGKRNDALAILDELVDEGVVVRPTCKGAAFGLGTSFSSGTSRVPMTVPPPTNGGTRSGWYPPYRSSVRDFSNGSVPAPVPDEAAARRAKQAEEDARKLEATDRKNWKAIVAGEGWPAPREAKARALAKASIEKAHNDGVELWRARARGEDPKAWATEQGWENERTSKAMTHIDSIEEKRR